jgi:chromosome segregation ATPase
MLDPSGGFREPIDLSEPSTLPMKGEMDMQATSPKLKFTKAENKLIRERAEATGQSIADYIRARALGEVDADGPDVSVLQRQVVQLRSRCEALTAVKAELEQRLTVRTAEVEGLRDSDAGEVNELRQRLATLTEHLDTADRHVASLRDRLDRQGGESARHVAVLETRLRDREAELARINTSISSEAEEAARKLDELQRANQRLATEAHAANAAAARQRQSIESRVNLLLSDIEEMKKRNAEALGDRDRVITQLRQEIEKVRSAAGAEQAIYRQTITDLETARQRDAAQHARTVEVMKAKLAGVAREMQSAHEAGIAERQRLETALSETRERMRRQLDAHAEERRRIEARAEAAEKQAAGATAKATMEIARTNELEMRLSQDRAGRSEEIEALQQRLEALTAQLTTTQYTNELIIDDLRVRLAEFEGDKAATGAVAAARQRLTALLSEIDLLRTCLAEAEAKASGAAFHAAPATASQPVAEPEPVAEGEAEPVDVYEERPQPQPQPQRVVTAARPAPQSAPRMEHPADPGSSWRRHLVAGLGAKAVTLAAAARRGRVS